MRISLLLLSFVICCESFGQIIYTDINPDKIVVAANNDTYMIDFDNDGSHELMIFASVQDTSISGFSTTITGVALSNLGGSEIVGHTETIGNETLLIADTLLPGSTIDVNRNYINSSTTSVFPGVGLGVKAVSAFGNFSFGDFKGNGTLYFGVKFDVNGTPRYGWVRVSVVTDCTSGTFFDFAYGSSTDYIKAGAIDGGNIGLKENGKLDFNIGVQQGKIVVKTGGIQGQLVIHNLIGEEVYRQTIAKSTAIDASKFIRGIYLVSFYQNGNLITKKIML